MTHQEILDEIRKQQITMSMKSDCSEHTLYISKEYVMIIRMELEVYSPTITSLVQIEQRIFGMPFFTVLETGHIRVV